MHRHNYERLRSEVWQAEMLAEERLDTILEGITLRRIPKRSTAAARSQIRDRALQRAPARGAVAIHGLAVGRRRRISLLEALIAGHSPQGPTEEHLVEEQASTIWRKRRLRLGESAAHHRASCAPLTRLTFTRGGIASHENCIGLACPHEICRRGDRYGEKRVTATRP